MGSDGKWWVVVSGRSSLLEGVQILIVYAFVIKSIAYGLVLKAIRL